MSSDGESFEVEEVVAMQWQTINHMIKDDCVGDNILIPNVTAMILAKVIEFCKHTMLLLNPTSPS
ncbi:unnamed protein product [Linum tenue]|uniref:SKP1 component POZ domain-containing protein n=2 Tax=Linum tenue TaxID=586396 RepID=A0AAV0Q3M3_9ROSI|nr:unnamed protein product [Linum tenue]